MRVLVTYGSKMGGTAGLAEMIGDALWRHDVAADVWPVAVVPSLAPYDAVIVGGALYNSRWHRDAQRFVKRHSRELRALPVWLFSSGPLGDAEQHADIPPVRGVARLMGLIGARGHETFGGRLVPDSPGFLAPAMVKTWEGDWRDPDQVERWVAEIVTELTAPDRGAAGSTQAAPSHPT
jgi:menaquinone-dependent protoporphyrinogen oxidase